MQNVAISNQWNKEYLITEIIINSCTYVQTMVRIGICLDSCGSKIIMKQK